MYIYTMRLCTRHKQIRGNILFLILLAIVLFAALSYAVTSSMRGGGRDAGSENAELGAAQILQWFTAVDNAVMRMELSGIKYEDMSFVYDGKYYGGNPLNNYMNNTRCTSDTCRIFKPDGGGVAPPDFLKYGTKDPTGASGSSLSPGGAVLLMAQWPGAGTDLNDVTVFLYYISIDVCTAIRNKLSQSITPVVGGTPVYGHVAADWDNPAYIYTTNANVLYGKDTNVGSFGGTGNGRYCHIHHVAIKR